MMVDRGWFTRESGCRSCAGNPPKYGDFEAQRHWMEITTNLPIKEWYANTTLNDLSYSGLDYPPLTAYQSYVHGLLPRFFHPESAAIFTSRGHESYLGKLLMRWTVLSSDAHALIFFPSYNCISLGLTVGAIASVLSDKDLVASVLYCLALSHKQVLSLLTPFERGIYEDYVANFWCTTSVLVKWKRLFTIQSLKLLSLSATITTFQPSMVQQIKAPSKQGFLYGLLNSAFSFYLFSFQVGILLHSAWKVYPVATPASDSFGSRRGFSSQVDDAVRLVLDVSSSISGRTDSILFRTLCSLSSPLLCT
ncbi:hypothetical protein FNV43_RR10361 [Rhamnella rubrinervis]|uniref:Alpha-1,3-glucosyltransferase n=1 Tax=Rhamnella rubrinervis TaxID=2594499 RepID=A0A8K0ML91_9ROSA|nr:hypothetical protein FNV43_RR10361 [Rhamnella rubrinervis]